MRVLGDVRAPVKERGHAELGRLTLLMRMIKMNGRASPALKASGRRSCGFCDDEYIDSVLRLVGTERLKVRW